MTKRFIGIDVGGIKKGFHGICIENGCIISKINHIDPLIISEWCNNFTPSSIAIDSPCGWSSTGYSRKAERDLRVNNYRIKCFCTPKKKIAKNNSFYNWVFNGMNLYKNLKKYGYDPIETYPHGITCCVGFDKKKSKIENRMSSLSFFLIKLKDEKCIDFIDATLCAVTAKYFYLNKVIKFGNNREGFIYLPNLEI